MRILNFSHAVEHLGTVAQALFRPGTAAASEWLGRQVHALRHSQEAAVLADLGARQATVWSEDTRAVLAQT